MSLEKTLKTAATIVLVATALATNGCGNSTYGTRIKIPRALERRAEGLQLPDSPEEHIYLSNLNGKQVEVLRNVHDNNGDSIGNMLLVRQGHLRRTTFCYWDKDYDGKPDVFIMNGAGGEAHTRNPHKDVIQAYKSTVQAAYRHLREQGRAP